MGARQSVASRSVARRFRARRLPQLGVYVVERARAREFARVLRARGLYVFSEPNRLARLGTARDPGSDAASWRDVIVDPNRQEPAVGPTSPALGLIDTPAAIRHQEFRGGNVSKTEDIPPYDEHGTATAAVAAAPVNGMGIVGVWPRMRAFNLPLRELTCAEAVRRIMEAIELGVAAINMSYGATELCFAEYVALQFATGAGIVPVAAAGNEFNNGNPTLFPASLPHVLTVAGIGPDFRASFFSSASAAIDLAAPAEGIVTAVPPAFDSEDGNRDGYAALDGTSFAAPMAAAAVAWARAERPNLSGFQANQVVRLSARDLEDSGYDPSTGFGLLDIDAALSLPAPPDDPFEPNDDVIWVDGRAFGSADPPIFRRARRRALRAFLDQVEDPDDVYRIVFPRRSRLSITIKPTFGDVDLRVFDEGAETVDSRRFLVASSARNGRRRDRVIVANRARSSQVAYIHAYIDPVVDQLDAGYRLVIRRLRRR